MMKHTHAYYFISLLAGSLVLVQCGNENLSPPYVDDSKAYFPLQAGRYIEYQVDSIVFDDAPGGNTKDTIRFQLREEVGQYHLGVSGDTVFYINRFRREHTGQSWILTDVWSAQYDRNKVLRTEENLIFHKMTFPLYRGQRWSATDYIHPGTQVRIGTENLRTYQYWNSLVLGIDESGTFGDFTYGEGQVMRVRQVDDDDDLTKRYVHEVYVRGIGLVERIDTILDSRCVNIGDFTPCIDKPWTVHAEKGYILSQVMIDHN